MLYVEHNLGLTCDPIDGLVQVPCIVCLVVICLCFSLWTDRYYRNVTAWEVRHDSQPRVRIYLCIYLLAVKAVTAAQLSMASQNVYSVTLDEAIEAMRLTAADMSVKYKETSLSVSICMGTVEVIF